MSEYVKFLNGFLNGWAADIRASIGISVDADNLEDAASIITSQADEIDRLRTALSEAEQRARRETLEEAAKTAETFRRKQLGRDLSKATFDPCGRWVGGEIYEQGKEKNLIASRIRALIPSEPHDAEGRE